MQDKLIMSKTEIENAQKYIESQRQSIEKLKQEKKDLQKKIKTKNSVVLQQETQIQQKQEQIDEQLKLINEIRRENERQLDSLRNEQQHLVNKKDTDVSSFKQQQMNQQKQFLDECNKKVFDMQVECQKKDIEIKELTSLNQMLKTKLEESQKSLESNAQMISWLNKQLNEKGVGSSIMPSSFKNTVNSSASLNKPPLMTMGSAGSGSSMSGFKPTFSSIDQLSTGASTLGTNQLTKVGQGNFERSPLRNTTSSVNMPSPMSSTANSFI